MNVTIQPNHAVCETAVEVNSKAPDLVRVALRERGYLDHIEGTGHPVAEAAITLTREHWQEVVDQLVVAGVVRIPTAVGA